MKAFQHLIIRKDEDSLIKLLQVLRTTRGKHFEYRKIMSERYASMIFSDISKVACFKSNRVSLFESMVWVVIADDKFYVTNITSDKNRELGISDYNLILNSFFLNFVSKHIDNSFKVEITGSYIELSETLPHEVYRKLNFWADTCNKDGGTLHPDDYKRWMDFVIAAHKYHIQLKPSDLSKWLSEDKNWSCGYNDTISKVSDMYEYGMDLLNAMEEYEAK